MDQPVKPLSPVNEISADRIIKVDDTGNRTARTAANTSFWSAVVYALNRWTDVDFTVEDLMILLPALTIATTYIVNLAEYRNWIPSTKKTSAEIAPPRNAEGEILAQVKAP